MISYQLDGKEKIHQGEDCLDENGKIYWRRHSPVLFPIVGKLKRNYTTINGRRYDITQHGFARDLEFEPITKLDNFHSYVLRSTPNTLAKFPFEFSLFITYRTDENKLSTIYKVINEGETPMPFGIGGHPAFSINKTDLLKNEYYLEFEEPEEKIHFLYLVDGLIGTEYAKNIIQDKKIIQITKNTFDNDAVIMKNLTSKKISLMKKTGNKKLLTMDFSDFPYLAIWSKPGAPFISIEPWRTTADTINTNNIFINKPDTIVLSPKKEFECKYIVEFFN